MVVIVVGAVPDDDYDDYYDTATAPSSAVFMVIDGYKFIRQKITEHVFSLTVPHCRQL